MKDLNKDRLDEDLTIADVKKEISNFLSTINSKW